MRTNDDATVGEQSRLSLNSAKTKTKIKWKLTE